ncbi:MULTISPECIES: hypothetical protein [unclassified Streptomyces]|uniref:hypothetical protein n=1 Tax=unclassified Streptomyces TaxID=2593676 RepID=UPI002DD96936|nr:hypothetical protein [Streptomyces sp. NBC_01750]WSA98587.1 hypothetical protein OIE54_04550 [Streptomyces sp. NBC_01794]WSD36878.1 hypothetical protein OG966_36240 [Streptomyces sp. NBC_01750]
MAIPSSSGSSSTLLFQSDRTFRVWRYGVGHSQLLLRAAPDAVEATRLDLLFEGVDAMRLVTRYEAIELHSVSETEFQRIYDESGLDPKWKPHRLIVALRSGSGSGYVQCQKASAMRGAANGLGPDEPSESVDVIWSLRR